MNRERIQRAITALNTVHGKQFAMDLWIDYVDHGCGTRACAAGWLHMLGTFKEDGYLCTTSGPHFDGQQGHMAMASLLDITPRQAASIFVPYDGPMHGAAGRNEVVRKLRELLEHPRPEAYS